MKYVTLTALAFCLLAACNDDKKGTETVTKVGDRNAAQTPSTQTITGKIQVSDDLKSKGMKFGKYTIEKGSGGETFNVLHIYVTFSNDVKEMVNVRVLDAGQNEYGRASKKVKGKNGDAKWVDFEFDSRTNLEDGSSFTIE